MEEFVCSLDEVNDVSVISNVRVLQYLVTAFKMYVILFF